MLRRLDTPRPAVRRGGLHAAPSRHRRIAWGAAAALLAAAVFVVDTLTGYESAIAVLYALVLVVGAQGRGRGVIVALAAVCGTLAVVSFAATHSGDIDTGNVGRILVALVAIAMTAALLVSRLTVHNTRLALEESEANLRTVADSVPQILWQARPDGRMVYLSRRWTEMTGASVADGLGEDGRALFGWFHPEDRQAMLEHWAEVLDDGQPFESYRRLRTADGDYRWVQISARPIRATPSGEILKWYGVATDIDAEMRAQLTVRALNETLEERVAERTAELARSERRYRSAFEQSHVAMFEMDVTEVVCRVNALNAAEASCDMPAYLVDHPDALEHCLGAIRVLDANDAAVRLLGAERREQIVGHEGPFLRERTREIVEQYHALLAGNQTIEAASEVARLDGRLVKVLFGISPIDAPHGRSHVLVGMIDVTERERVQELLLAAQEDLARANRAATVGALSASIAHELNQPIGAVMMDAQTAARWLDRNPPDLASARRALGRVAGNAERASDILRRTREQLVKGRRTVRPLDLGEVVRSALTLVERELRISRTRVALRVAPDLPPTEADRIELQQVLVNLVVNAIHAMRQNAPAERTIGITVGRRGAELLHVAVADRGSGIDPAHMDRLFEPFFTTRPEGMGMGLQICRATVQSFGGDMSARNNDGAAGATFEFTLPHADAPAAPHGAAEGGEER